jgi:hypothetical protein
MKSTKHIKSNQSKIDFYNRMTKICQPLDGGRNSSPQNSGEIMANIHLSRPIFRSNGNCIKNGSYADSRQIRGIENVKTLLSKITDDELKYFQFMQITEANCTNIHRGIVAKKWNWIYFENKSEVLELINENIKMLSK